MALLDLSDMDPMAGEADKPLAFHLGGAAMLAVWDVPEPVRSPASLSVAEAVAVAPTASLRLPRQGGGTRLLWVLRRPEGRALHATLAIEALGLSAELTVAGDAPLPALDAAILLDGLEDRAGATLASTLLNLWSGLFRLNRNAGFVRAVGALLHRLDPSPQPAAVVARAVDGLALVQTPFPAGFGPVRSIHRIGARGVEKLKGEPHRAPLGSGREMLHLLAALEAAEQGGWLAICGQEGIVVRRLLRPERRPPSLTAWLREHGKKAAGLREHLLAELSGLAASGSAASVEVQLAAPLDRQQVTGAGLAAEIACALSTPSGTLVTGWFRDPLGLVAGIAAVTESGTVHDLTGSLHRFPVTAEAVGGGRVAATGFAALAPSPRGAAPLLQPRFRLLLRSGAYHPLVPAPQPADPAEARAAALRAVPPQHVSETLLANVLTPVIAELHRRTQARANAPRLHRIGELPARPKASVVIPLYKALDFLRFQIAAFAMDPWFRQNAELIYVLDSPEQAAEVEHLIGGLHLVYGLPVLLAVMERNGGYARACNAGAALARGDVLALVNSDVVPVSHGWLQALASRLDGRRRIGAVGPKLLFEDGSLQHAGMYFERDHRGRWLNHHFYKGMPRFYPPATEERVVPAVTGACLVTSRELFEKVGGFTEDYVIGDYEDSDLCLKISAAERRILYAPEVELYHLERKSMTLSGEYMKGVAWQYNCALHASRWGDRIAAIMSAYRKTARTRSKAA
ncbi:glycosyltransferase [Microvirga thermotolerans]|uniref:Glycosyltransferase n=1 Tax=Microvirga thermotolerans TaxID=2651334 RepID=A0A5P9JZW9_9HYPH|nr:glycosyltransferase [Microvirga thermotolerans]QFU17186.1 glycosyltransferase [Microvirga thermotolerans]